MANPQNKTKKEVFFNSWIYNTSCTFQIDNFPSAPTGGSASVILKTKPDKSNLKVGDKVDIIRRGG